MIFVREKKTYQRIEHKLTSSKKNCSIVNSIYLEDLAIELKKTPEMDMDIFDSIEAYWSSWNYAEEYLFVRIKSWITIMVNCPVESQSKYEVMRNETYWT